MQTVKELLEELQINNLPHMADGSFNITAAQHANIISLLSQQAEGIESDEEAADKYIEEKVNPHCKEWKYDTDTEIIAIGASKHSFLAGCQHVRQQLSQFIQHRLKVLDNDIENAKAELQSTTDNDVKIMMRDIIKNTIIRIDELEEALRHCGATPSQQQQQRSYSEEDMKEAYSHGIDVEAGYSRIFSFDEWLTKYNQLKK